MGGREGSIWKKKTKMEEREMNVISMKQLLEAGVHFGHQTRRWNPKMAQYIFTERNGIYIIDLQKTVKKVEEAYKFTKEIAETGKPILFVGTKKQAQEAIKEEAERCGMFYVNERWLGGMLTNFKTIEGRIQRLRDLEAMQADGTFEVLPKKEVSGLKNEMEKLEKNLGGIKDMKEMPGVMFVVDPKKERIAILEARKLNIPVFGIVDTNCDPDLVDYVIPGNDDAVRAVKVILGVLANAINEAQDRELVDFVTEEDKIKEIAKTLKEKHSAFYLGRGLDYNIAMEGALKIKEISYIHAEAFAAGELKHGTIALIEEGTPVIAIATQEELFEKMVSNMQEVKARGAYVIAIAQEHNKEVEKAADKVIYIPNVDDIVSSILTVLPLQLLSYYVAVERGCDVDKPRNLAKSVTVE